MKYMIMLYGSRQDYDVLAGKPGDKPAMSPEDIAKMHEHPRARRWSAASWPARRSGSPGCSPTTPRSPGCWR
jgi:hypothetical protein